MNILFDKHTVNKEEYLGFNKSIIDGVEIKQCRRTPYDYKSHVHNELSLGYILDGSTELTVSDRIIEFVRGDGVIIPPLTTHRCAPRDIENWAYIMLFIKKEYYQDVIDFRTVQKIQDEKLMKLIEFIDLLLSEDDPIMLEDILIGLLIEFGEEVIADHTSNGEVAVRAVREYLLNHVQDVITLEDLQDLSGLNKFTLIRNFKKFYVTTPAAFHLQCRVSEAKKLLSEEQDIFEICAKLHFCDQAHLIREFKKMYGITPTAYLQQLKQ